MHHEPIRKRTDNYRALDINTACAGIATEQITSSANLEPIDPYQNLVMCHLPTLGLIIDPVRAKAGASVAD